MTDTHITLVGAGRMGSALAGGWLKAGHDGNIDIVDPTPAEIVQTWTTEKRVRLNPDPTASD
ncbi:MAG: NAD(P)-binding domain-containing protein, partial [Pseudomonadota bacterium]